MTALAEPKRGAVGKPNGARPLTDTEFALFQALIYREAGIHLSDKKKTMLAARLTRRLRELGFNSFGKYYRHVANGDGSELVRMLDIVTTNETKFFREPRHFEFLEQQVVPAWTVAAERGHRARRIRAWSAGCSTGQEPYSIAMLLRHHFPESSGWQIDILATDLSTRALERAASAIWPVEKAKEIPPAYLKAFMLQGTATQEGRMTVSAEIRRLVRFQRLNLNEANWPVRGEFDLIFCRNVLIYFSAASRSRVVTNLEKHLAPSGYFFVGHAESVRDLPVQLRAVIPTVYAHAAAGATR